MSRTERYEIRSADVADIPAVLAVWAQGRSAYAGVEDSAVGVEQLLAFDPTALLVAELCLAPSGQSYATDPHIAAFVQVFANGTPAQVRCPDSFEEWSFDLGDPVDAQDVYGRTFTRTAVVEFRSDLCPILDDLVSSAADDSTKALAVLPLVHESYHVRRWSWRLDEARVECEAIRHFRVRVR